MVKAIRQNTKMIAMLKGLLFAYLITFLMLLLLSVLMLNLDLPSAIISGGVNLSYIASSFIGGFFAGKKIDQRKFLWGLLIGVCYFVILMLISLMLNNTAPLPMKSLFMVFAICGVSGMVGGMLS